MSASDGGPAASQTDVRSRDYLRKKRPHGAVAGHTSSDRGLCRRQTSFHPAQDPSTSSSKKNYVVTDSWNAQASTLGHQKAYIVARVFFFVVAPFCSCPASLVSRNFFAVGPGCAKCFFFVALRWAPRPFGGARAQKKTPPRVFFFAPAPGERQGKEKPRAGTGPEQKKKTPPRVFFFCCGPGERQGKEKPRWAPQRGQSKKKTPPRVFFFLLRPRGKAGEGEASLGAGTSAYASEPKRTRLSPWHCRARPAGPDRGAVRR